MTRRLLTLLFSLLLINASLQAANFTSLYAHWNFDEGRDWHNMSYPFTDSSTTAKDSVGTNTATLSSGMDSCAAWVSGRQFSGLRFSAGDKLTLSSAPTLTGNVSISYWIKTSANGTDVATTSPGILGSASAVQWGVLTSTGRLAVRTGNTVIAQTAVAVNDDRWHHIVITRNSSTGAVYIYLDGTLSGTGSSSTSLSIGSTTLLGAINGGASFDGILDQVHLFNALIDADTIADLNDNHAPKAFGQDSLMQDGRTITTGSVLHLWTFDPDQDTLSVSRFGQPSSGTVTYNNDGTFRYTPTGSPDRDQFTVTVTDGRGGFSETVMTLKNQKLNPPHGAISGYTNVDILSSLGTSKPGTGRPIPKFIDINGDGLKDILISSNSRIYLLKNTGTATSPQYAAPVLLQTSTLTSDIFTLYDMNGDGLPDIVLKVGNNLRIHYQIASTTQGADSTFSTATNVYVKDSSGANFSINGDCNVFDIVDFDNDGAPDIIQGTYSNGTYWYKNAATSVKGDDMRIASSRTQIFGGAYNHVLTAVDLNEDGKKDIVRTGNWELFEYYVNSGEANVPIINGQSGLGFSFTKADGSAPLWGDYFSGGSTNPIINQLDGARLDVADINGDGTLDMIFGGYAGNGELFIAYGVSPDVTKDNLKRIEEIFDANLPNLGTALEANSQELLNKYRTLIVDWTNWARGLPTIDKREAAYQDLKRHVTKYPDFLRRKTLNTTTMHHVPSILLQYWILLHCLKEDSAAHRVDVADTIGMTGLDRAQYLQSGLAVGDNSKCSDGQMLSITQFMKYHPRLIFPDDHISIDQLFGDGRAGAPYVFISNKNTFGNEVSGNPSHESPSDIVAAGNKFLWQGSSLGDYFTLVLAHEVCHSVDRYVNMRANKNLTFRWRDMLVWCANNGGAVDCVVGNPTTGAYDSTATSQRFRTLGLWDGTGSWNDAWDAYWATGPGAAYKNLCFTRGNIGWFLNSQQESFATQANIHWTGSEARLVGAIDRYNRGYKSNITEVIHFFDVLSAGLNKFPVYNFQCTTNPGRVNFIPDHAWLERNDKGWITKVTIKDRTTRVPRVYGFAYDEVGRIVEITSGLFAAQDDTAVCSGTNPVRISPLVNDEDMANGDLTIKSITSPLKGTVTLAPDKKSFIYTPNSSGFAAETFTYVANSDKSGDKTATVSIISQGVLFERWNNITGTAVSALTSNANYPNNPSTTSYLTNFETEKNIGDNYGARLRGYVTIPVTGVYKFHILGDDAAQVLFSSSGNPAATVSILNLTSYKGLNTDGTYNWNNAVNYGPTATLTAGTKVYFDLLFKESSGGDYCVLGWSYGANSSSLNSPAPIPASAINGVFGLSAPTLLTSIPNQSTALNISQPALNLNNYFTRQDLIFSVYDVQNASIAEATVSSSGMLSVAAKAVGSTRITIAAEDPDSGQITLASFTQTVTAPFVYSLALSPTTWEAPVSGGTQSISVTANSAWTVQVSSPTLTTTTSSGSGNGTFSLTLPANTDDGSRTFTVTVTCGDVVKTIAVTQRGTKVSYADWQQENFGTDAGKPGTGLSDSYMNDGVANLLKYALGLDPKKRANSIGTTGQATVSGKQHMTATYPLNPAMTGVTLKAESSTDLKTWTTFATPVPTSGQSTLIIQDPEPLGAKPAKFIRLRATQAP